MHVLVCANTTRTIWHFRRALIAALLDDGHRVSILAPFDKTADRLEQMGCSVVHLAMNAKGLNPLGDLFLLWQIRREIAKGTVDAMLTFTVKNNIYGAIAATSLGIPALPNVTGLGTAFISEGFLWKLAEILYRYAFRSVPAVFFQNADDRDLFLSLGIVREEQVNLLPGSGVDLDHFTEVRMPISGPTTFLFIARLLRDKGIIEFVEAARLVKKIQPEVRFQILGELGALNRSAIHRTDLDRWIQEGLIEYLGTSDDVRLQISEASCVVLPSYREGAPRVLIEASAMARPVITTDVPGCRSVVDDGRTGFLCEVRNVESLRDAILRFLVMPNEARAQMGHAGRKKMEQEFDQVRVIDAYRSVLSRLQEAQKLDGGTLRRSNLR